MGNIIWLSSLSIVVLIILLICLMLIISVLPAIRSILQQLLIREQRTLNTINNIKMAINYRETNDIKNVKKTEQN